MQTRAQVSISFHWLFIIIIGAVVLAFFFSIIHTQQQRAAIEEASSLALTLDTVFSTITNNPDTTRKFPIMNAELIFRCEEGLSDYTIQGAGPESTHNDIIFTPARLEGDEILTWTQSWHAPFDAGIITYLANDRTFFLFINDSDLVEELYEELPGNETTPFFKKALQQPEDAITLPTGNDRYIIIATNEPDLLTVSESQQAKTVVRILPEEEQTVTFKRAGDDTMASIAYATREELWGALFTEDPVTYDCTMKKAQEKLTNNAKILKERATLMIPELDPDDPNDQRCEGFLNQAIIDLDIIIRETGTERQAAIIDLENTQRIMQRGGPCPLIY